MSTFPSSRLSHAGVDSALFRRAMRTVPTGVAVITTVGLNGAYVGLTVNSIASLSLTPPLISWALKENSPSLADFQHSRAFVVNLLAAGQEELSRRFSSPTADRFEALEVTTSPSGLPRLPGCAASLECAIHSDIQAGDHILLIGMVHDVQVHDIPALGYCSGRYFQAAISTDTVFLQP